jgi:predicted KAP-like P-loop ATPase
MDPTSNPIIVEIGGRPITLHFDFNTYKKFEELTKKFFMNWFGELQNASFKLIKDVRHSQKMSSISRNDDGQLVDNKGRVPAVSE